MSETSAGMYLHDCTELLSDREQLTVTSGALRSRGVRGRSGVREYAAYLRRCCRALDGCREMNKCRGAASGDRTLGITSFHSMSIALHPSLHRHPDDYTSTYTDSPLALLPIYSYTYHNVCTKLSSFERRHDRPAQIWLLQRQRLRIWLDLGKRGGSASIRYRRRTSEGKDGDRGRGGRAAEAAETEAD
jgi:hypothetical protein